MALVCDFKSETPLQSEPLNEEEIKGELALTNEDLEDGEIEDDDEEVETIAEQKPNEEVQNENIPRVSSPIQKLNDKSVHNKSRFERNDRHTNRYEDRKRTHLTEAEKSVMRLHKLERLEREKRDRYKREQVPVVDDFACNLEKAIASVLKKDKKQNSEDEKEDEDKRGKKRKKKDKDKRKVKPRKGSPKSDDFDENEMLNVRRGSPDRKDRTCSSSPRSDYDSYDSSCGSDRSREDKKDRKKRLGRKNKERTRDKKSKDRRDHKTEVQQTDTICTYYLQGKCNKGDDCPFSHGISNPMKLELCKFYLMECCAKGDNCLYMHSQFPCKFYHMGIPCKAGEFCKFSHGKPLSEVHKQILFKHIETAPKEILGDFPRLSRDGALTMINQAQKTLEIKFGTDKNDSNDSNRGLIPSLFELNIPVPSELLSKDGEKDKQEKPTGRERSRPSRWQSNDQMETQEKLPLMFGLQGFYSERGDQDMRITSNGDIDMRTLPPQITTPQPQLQLQEDVDIRKETRDIDIRQMPVMDNQMDVSKDVDIRVNTNFVANQNDVASEEPNLEIDTDPNEKEDETKGDIDIRKLDIGKATNDLPATLPKMQRELFLRIQAQQKENLPENQPDVSDEEHTNIDWYSDDDDDRLTIKDDVDESKAMETSLPQPSQIKPVEVIEKLGDLSKIDISAEVTKLLSSISQATTLKETPKEPPKDPRVSRTDVVKSSPVRGDPRKSRVGSADSEKPERISIYEQGSLSIENAIKDIDLRNVDQDLRSTYGDTDLRPTPGRPDIDLRQLGLPFKAMQNYTPATEIDASINSHLPITWRVHIVDIPQPDYAGLKLSAHEAQNTGDPRMRKLFRLSIEEKDSPASPKESPKTLTGIRADPRRRKLEEKPDNLQLNYSQQLNVLQTSPFYQSLTSNQKLLLNQELSTRSDHTGTNDPTLNSILSTLGLIPGTSTIATTCTTTALGILANVNNMNPMLGQQAGLMVPNSILPPFVNQPNILTSNPNIVNQIAQSVVQPGLLGNAPSVVTDFQLNFDPRQGGLLGNAPPINFTDNSNFNYGGEEFYESNNRGRGRGFRDRNQQRRGGRNFNSGRNGGRNFRNRNRANRSRTPP